MKPAIEIDRVAKVYRLGSRQQGEYATLRETLMRAAKAPWQRLRRIVGRENGTAEGASSHWALRDVSFDIEPGEVIGIIGRNGAGKSTLLKILSQITEPSSGRIVLRGRVGSLLEVGTGFHHELSGRENIYLNGAILGMTRREITRKFDDIVAFADIGPFLDTAVKHYSSGMYVRLAFAVASHLEPEILIVDEVLAVGDAAFQRKCLGKMSEVSRSGRTVLFVSHSMAAIENLCERVAVLERGRLAFVGATAAGIEQYLNSCDTPQGGDLDLSAHPLRKPQARPILRRLRILNSSGVPTDRLPCDEPLSLEITVDEFPGVPHPHFGVALEDAFGGKLFTVGSYLTDTPIPEVRGPARLVCRLEGLPVAPGRYSLTVFAGPLGQLEMDRIDQAAWIDVTDSDFYGNGRLPEAHRGRFLVRSQWRAVDSEVTPT